MTGPDLLKNLFYVLIHFRQYQFAVSVDIEGMFMQVGVIPQDQASLRFFKAGRLTEEIDVYQYMRHILRDKD